MAKKNDDKYAVSDIVPNNSLYRLRGRPRTRIIEKLPYSAEHIAKTIFRRADKGRKIKPKKD